MNNSEALKLMVLMPHPDDETFSAGAVMAKYAAEGVETYLVMATRGERGWPGDPDKQPTMEELGRIREEELRCAMQTLGVHEVYFLGYIDGDVSKAGNEDAIRRIVPYLRQVRPQVVITFDPFGVYGHPDHIAIMQYALASVVAAANPAYQDPDGLPPHMVSKLYFNAETEAALAAEQEVIGEFVVHMNGKELRPVGWKDWAITTVIDVADYWDTFVQALGCHQTQMLQAEKYAEIPKRFDRSIWARKCYFRAFSMVDVKDEIETDLFAGVRQKANQA